MPAASPCPRRGRAPCPRHAPAGVVLDLAGEAIDPPPGRPGPPPPRCAPGRGGHARSGRPARRATTRAARCTPTSGQSGPRPGIAPNRPTISTASGASASWSPSAKRLAEQLVELGQSPAVVANLAVGLVTRLPPGALADQPREVDVESASKVDRWPASYQVAATPHGRSALTPGSVGEGGDDRGPRPATRPGRPRAAPPGRRCGARPAGCSMPLAATAQPQLADRALLVRGGA